MYVNAFVFVYMCTFSRVPVFERLYVSHIYFLDVVNEIKAF